MSGAASAVTDPHERVRPGAPAMAARHFRAPPEFSLAPPMRSGGAWNGGVAVKTLVSASLAALCTACSARLAEFSVVSRRAAIEEPAAPPLVAKERVSGRSCRKQILFFIPIGPKADLSDAFDAALASAPGANALLDVTVRRETLITVVYNEYCFVVEGKAVAFRAEPREASR